MCLQEFTGCHEGLPVIDGDCLVDAFQVGSHIRDPVHDRIRATLPIGVLSSGGVPSNQTKVEHVALLGHVPTEDLLRGDPCCGPQERPGPGETGFFGHRADTKVEDLDPVGSEHHVRRLEVTVGDPGVVDCLEGLYEPLGGEPENGTGEGPVAFHSFLEGFTFDEAPWTTPKPLADSRVAIVTTAGLRPAGGDGADWNPGDQAMQLLPASADDLVLAHFSPNFDRTGWIVDPNLVFPIDRLAEMADEGTIGSVADVHVSFMGAQIDHTLETIRLDTGPAAARALLDDDVDLVLLTPV